MAETCPGPVLIETTDVSIRSHVEDHLRVLADRGWRPTFVCADTGLVADIVRLTGARPYVLSMARDPAPWRDLCAMLRLIALLRRLRPTLVVYGTPKASLLGAMAAAACRVPRRVYVLHGLRSETLRGAGKFVQLVLERLVLGLSHEVVAVSPSLVRTAARHGLPVGAARVLGAGSVNGVDTRRFRPHTEWPQATAADEVVIGFVGRLHRDKGTLDLLAAFAAARACDARLRLHLVGDWELGEDDAAIVQRAVATSDGAIRASGSTENVAAALASFDIVTLPTYREGLPTVLLEAAAMGLPVVATRATGVVDVIPADDLGWLCDVGDVAGLTEQLLACARDSHREERAARLRERVLADFSRPVVTKRWVEEYERHLSTLTSSPQVEGRSAGRASPERS